MAGEWPGIVDEVSCLVLSLFLDLLRCVQGQGILLYVFHDQVSSCSALYASDVCCLEINYSHMTTVNGLFKN